MLVLGGSRAFSLVRLSGNTCFRSRTRVLGVPLLGMGSDLRLRRVRGGLGLGAVIRFTRPLYLALSIDAGWLRVDRLPLLVRGRRFFGVHVVSSLRRSPVTRAELRPRQPGQWTLGEGTRSRQRSRAARQRICNLYGCGNQIRRGVIARPGARGLTNARRRRDTSHRAGWPRSAMQPVGGISRDMSGSLCRARCLPQRRTARSIHADAASCERRRTGRRSPAATLGSTGRPRRGRVPRSRR